MQTTKNANYQNNKLPTHFQRGGAKLPNTNYQKCKLPKLPTTNLFLGGGINYQMQTTQNANYQNYKLPIHFWRQGVNYQMFFNEYEPNFKKKLFLEGCDNFEFLIPRFVCVFPGEGVEYIISNV